MNFKDRLSFKVEDMGFDSRAQGALKWEGFRIAAQLLFLPENDFKRMANVGKKTLAEVKAITDDFGTPLGALSDYSNSDVGQLFFHDKLWSQEISMDDLVHAVEDHHEKIETALKGINSILSFNQSEQDTPTTSESIEISAQVKQDEPEISSGIKIPAQAQKYVAALQELGIESGDLSADFADAIESVLERRYAQEMIARSGLDDGPAV